ncbi:tetratricopeptide repeat protein [Pseudodesulfovibrio sp. zrk46]|uniref:tetratricopeptide repeat protein n=1 Tax=Pseudodesulfovibrio sp. zrk46 TaxID=2725288 RepID=UPI001B363673|nr:tetratricopeptide repeat protein [Pseudodesulfovibrio sp. zrk46]
MTKSRGCTGLDNPDEPLKCVFSTVSEIKVGTGTTAKKQKSCLLWYVKQQDLDAFGVRKINPQFVPVGDEEIIDRETLLADYTPEVEIHNTQVEPAMQGLSKALATGDKHREKGESLSAEMEYNKALEVDVSNVRAIFGLGLVYLDRNDREKSRAVLKQLVGMKAAFDVKHKHLFNEFGINLRKNQLYEESIQYYTRAVELTKDDENLFYNLARVFYEKADWENCLEFLSRTLTMEPSHEYALAMCRFVVALSESDKLLQKHGKPPVPKELAAKAACHISMDNNESFEAATVSGKNDFGMEELGVELPVQGSPMGETPEEG